MCFVSCWTAAAAEPHVDHDASAVYSSPSPVNVGPTAMGAYTAQSGPLASNGRYTHAWVAPICKFVPMQRCGMWLTR